MPTLQRGAALLLLFSGCLSGQAFVPPSGRGCPASVNGGPCGKRLMSARSADGLSFARTNRIVTDQGDVPDLVVGDEGAIYLYYVGATVGPEINKLAVAISRDRGETWSFQRANLEGFEGWSEPVDPDVQLLPGGIFRIFLTTAAAGEPLRTWYAEGTDGIHFARKGRAFDPPGDPLDPSTLRIGDTWHIFAGGQTTLRGANWHGTSADGANFTFVEELPFVKDGRQHAVSNGIAVDGGYRFYAFTHDAPPVINSFFTTDGATWTPDPGARLEMDSSTGLESAGVKDAAVVRLADGSYFMIYVTTIQEPAAPATSDLEFRADPGARVRNASLPKPSVDTAGAVHLYYQDESNGPPREMVSVSTDGLIFPAGAPPNGRDWDPRRLHLPNGSWRVYPYDPRAAELRSQSSTDGIQFTPDAGVRYVPQPADRNTFGVYDHFVDAAGGVVLLYLGDLMGRNNLRRAYSPPGDNGLTFRFDRGNILGDDDAGGGGNTYVDQKAIRLPDGRIRLFTMKSGSVYSFISEDDGNTFRQEPGVRISPTSFPDLPVKSLHDPWVVRLADGRYRMYVAAAVGPMAGVPPFAVVSATTAAPADTSSVTGAYIMAFHACDQAQANCGDPRNHRVYLAQSDDGVKWSILPGWKPYPGSVPDVIRRGNTLYIFAAGQNPLVRYHLDTGVADAPVAVDLPGLEMGFVDPSLILDDAGRLVLFFLPGKMGGDPAGCLGQTTCVQHFRSATENPASDGGRFTLNEGDRAQVMLGGPGAPFSASDPDIFFDGSRYVLYLSHGPSISVWTSTEMHGTYKKEIDLATGTGGIPSGYFDPASQRYWTYSHTMKNGVAVIRCAVHADLTHPLSESDWQTVITGPMVGLPATTNVESPGFAVFSGRL